MRVSLHGVSHCNMGIKNQDSCICLTNTGNIGAKSVKLVADGCTNVSFKEPEKWNLSHNEIGSGLFLLLYSLLETRFEEEKFVENANIVMKKMLELIGYKDPGDKDFLEKYLDTISYNFSFTIFAVFEKEAEFVVYHFGDGVILTQNNFDVISYIKKNYGKYPPYLVNNFFQCYGKKSFSRLTFKRENFKRVGVATDGILPLVEGKINKEVKLQFDKLLLNKNSLEEGVFSDSIQNYLRVNSYLFQDDVTIVF